MAPFFVGLAGPQRRWKSAMRIFTLPGPFVGWTTLHRSTSAGLCYSSTSTSIPTSSSPVPRLIRFWPKYTSPSLSR
ncbi:hypothetical protein D9M73_279120 [compost metagenome]